MEQDEHNFYYWRWVLETLRIAHDTEHVSFTVSKNGVINFPDRAYSIANYIYSTDLIVILNMYDNTCTVM